MSCLPGMPCYEAYKIAFPFAYGDLCDPNTIKSNEIIYNGPNLACTGIQSQDNLEIALQKIDTRLCSDEFVSHIIETIENNPVLKEYFCQLVSTCSFFPTTTTTTTTITPTPVTLTFVSYDDTLGATFNLSGPVGGVITIDGSTGFGPGWQVFKYDNLECDNGVGSVEAENTISWAIGESGNKSVLGTQIGLTGTRYQKHNLIRIAFTSYSNGSTFEVAGTTVTVIIDPNCETVI